MKGDRASIYMRKKTNKWIKAPKFWHPVMAFRAVESGESPARRAYRGDFESLEPPTKAVNDASRPPR